MLITFFNQNSRITVVESQAVRIIKQGHGMFAIKNLFGEWIGKSVNISLLEGSEEANITEYKYIYDSILKSRKEFIENLETLGSITIENIEHQKRVDFMIKQLKQKINKSDKFLSKYKKYAI